MDFALAFFVLLCISFLISPSQCHESTLTNIIPVSRRSFLNRRALAGDFDAVFARDQRQGVYKKYLAMAPEILLGILPAPQNDIEDFVQPNYPGDVALDTADIMEEVVQPIDVSDVLLTEAMTDVIDNDEDMMYYGSLLVGTPGQMFTFIVDTGSADLWIPSSWCGTCTNKHYDANESSTYVDMGRRFAVSYGSGSVYGKVVQDTITIAGTPVQKQAFGAVYRESEDFQDFPNDGLLGMAFGTIAQCGKPTLFENMVKQRKVKWPCFSIHLTRNQESGSEMCLGCYDPAKADGTPIWFPVTQRAYWSIAMNGVEVEGNRALFDQPIISAIDTGTTFLYLPELIADAIYAQIPGSNDASATYGSGFYTYPCSYKGVIAFIFGNDAFMVHPEDFNLGMSAYNPDDCIGGIFAMNADQWPPNLAIIGDEFLKSWYSSYDYSDGGRVGLAPSINNQW